MIARNGRAMILGVVLKAFITVYIREIFLSIFFPALKGKISSFDENVTR